MTIVSLCMIVRNAESHLLETLSSIVERQNGPICDEIVILDTGSTDRTQEILISYAKVHSSNIRWNIRGNVPKDWFIDSSCRACEGFGESVDGYSCSRCDGSGLKEGDGPRLLTRFNTARNWTFELAKGNWLGWIDADDLLLSESQIKERIEQKTWQDPPEELLGQPLMDLLSSLTPEVDALMTPRYCYEQNSLENPILGTPIRFVRNNQGWTWEYRIHEVLRNPKSALKVLANPEFIVEHHPKGIWPNRSRDVAVIRQILREEGDSFRMLAYLTSIYLEQGHFNSAEKLHNRLMLCASNGQEKYVGDMIEVDYHNARKNAFTAVEVLEEAYMDMPSFPDAPYVLSSMWLDIGNKTKALEWFGIGSQVERNGFRVLSNVDILKIKTKIKDLGLLII